MNKTIDDLRVWEMVEECLHDLEEGLYGAARNTRRLIYKTILDQLVYMLLIDGGPTFGLKVLQEGCADLRKWEAQRGRKEVGPFLSKAQRELLAQTPGRYLRQDIKITGPSLWAVTDGYS